MLFTPKMYVDKDGMTVDMQEACRKRGLLRTEGNAGDAAGAVRYLLG